jgi:hypothetical protein
VRFATLQNQNAHQVRESERGVEKLRGGVASFEGVQELLKKRQHLSVVQQSSERLLCRAP